MSENQVPEMDFETAKLLVINYERMINITENPENPIRGDVEQCAAIMQKVWDRLFTGESGVGWRGRPWGALNVNPSAFGTATVPQLKAETPESDSEDDVASDDAETVSEEAETGAERVYNLLEGADEDSLSVLRGAIWWFFSPGRELSGVQLVAVKFGDGDDYVTIKARLES